MMTNFKKALANKGFVVGGCIFLAIALIALVGPLVWTVNPNAQEMTLRLSAPSPAHPFGCDDFGRDLLARVIAGARVSLGVGIAVTLATSALGLVIGAYACYNERLDHILMRICDGLMSIPGVLLAIALMAMMGASVWNVIIALSIVYTPSMARIVWLHIVPNVMAPFLVQATFVFAEAVLSEAALSFLGLGIKAPDASWGNILQAGKNVMRKAWWMIFFPAVAIIASVLSLNLAGDGLRDALDPKAKEE